MASEKFLGFKDEKSNPFEVMFKDESCCGIQIVDEEALRKLELVNIEANIGQWVVVAKTQNDEVLVQGLFDSMEEAFDFARIKFGAKRILSLPEFND